jgi:hypothetical protein
MLRDLQATHRLAFVPVRSAVSIMEVWRAHTPPAVGPASAQESTPEASTVEAFMVEAFMVEADTDEHEASLTDKATAGERSHA